DSKNSTLKTDDGLRGPVLSRRPVLEGPVLQGEVRSYAA
ncbi:hypothetical protein MPH_14241, partial [Macrophomina phaseolina MS6]